MSQHPEDSVILVTGAAGFIGSHVCKRLIDGGFDVVGVDNLSDYYDVGIKTARLEVMLAGDLDHLVGDITDEKFVTEIFESRRPDVVIHLAAQSGVRYSLENPGAYIQNNVVGFANILEACRRTEVSHLLYASSSSVYGGNTKLPFDEDDRVDHPVSLYAATKKSNELMAYCYSHLFEIRMTGLRFFTVYGPYGRPDMAYFNFLDRYFNELPINIFKDGPLAKDLCRDFTYIDDVVESVLRLLTRTVQGPAQHEIFNVGGSRPESLSAFIDTLEIALATALGRAVAFKKVYVGNQPGDVPTTFASSVRLVEATGFHPVVPLSEGLQQFADWYVDYHGYASAAGKFHKLAIA